MTGRPFLRRLRRYTLAALALFMVVLATEQAEHHDLACHLKTPQHCGACAASPLGADPHTPVPIDTSVLRDAGSAVVGLRRLVGAVLPARASGRSPPVAA